MKLNQLYEDISQISSNLPQTRDIAAKVHQDTESSSVRKIREQQLENDRKQREEQQKILQPKIRDIDNRLMRMKANNDQTKINNVENEKEQNELENEINDFKSLIPHF